MGPNMETYMGPKFKPKARLVILGYEDPQLESLARDSPTLGKDSRSLIFQYAASTKTKIRLGSIMDFSKSILPYSAHVGLSLTPSSQNEKKYHEAQGQNYTWRG